MRKTTTLIFLSIALKQNKGGPRSLGTPFLVLILFSMDSTDAVMY